MQIWANESNAMAGNGNNTIKYSMIDTAEYQESFGGMWHGNS